MVMLIFPVLSFNSSLVLCLYVDVKFLKDYLFIENTIFFFLFYFIAFLLYQRSVNFYLSVYSVNSESDQLSLTLCGFLPLIYWPIL